MEAQPSFTKLHVTKHMTSGTMSCGQIRPKWSCFALIPSDMFGKKQTAFHQKHFTPTVKHSGGRVMSWACYAATGPGHLVIIELKSTVYQSISEANS